MTWVQSIDSLPNCDNISDGRGALSQYFSSGASDFVHSNFIQTTARELRYICKPGTIDLNDTGDNFQSLVEAYACLCLWNVIPITN